MEIDFEKIGKYSKSGPRYTSYPTAIEFKENEKVKTVYLKELEENSGELSLYFHLPFCRSACYFCGCNVVYTSRPEKRTRYIDYLKIEMGLLSKHLKKNREVVQIHFGGGTPTFFSAIELEEIILEIKKYFTNISKNAEISCEIDPRYLDEDQMIVLTKHGFNRVSFGVQDFDHKVQEAVHRIQSFETVETSVNLARKYGITSINIDLIYGLPHQTAETFQKTVELSLKLNPDRFAVFNYAHVPWLMKTMRKIDEGTLPKPSEKATILKRTIDLITDNGYKMIGMDHFAKESDELFLAIDKGELHRNFQGYTTKGGTQLLGIGLTSIGNGKSYYIQNYKDMENYEKYLEKGELPIFRGVALSIDDQMRRDIIMELMSNFKFDIVRFNNRYCVDFHKLFQFELDNLRPFEIDELLTISYSKIEINFTGSLIIRNIAMVFDSYMHNHIDSNKVFSKTV